MLHKQLIFVIIHSNSPMLHYHENINKLNKLQRSNNDIVCNDLGITCK